MHTELYCTTLAKLDSTKAIRAIHSAWLQLNAMGSKAEVDGTTYDNAPAMSALANCLSEAGHPGF